MNTDVKVALDEAQSALLRAENTDNGYSFAVLVDSALQDIKRAIDNYGGINLDEFPRLKILTVLG